VLDDRQALLTFSYHLTSAIIQTHNGIARASFTSSNDIELYSWTHGTIRLYLLAGTKIIPFVYPKHGFNSLSDYIGKSHQIYSTSAPAAILQMAEIDMQQITYIYIGHTTLGFNEISSFIGLLSNGKKLKVNFEIYISDRKASTCI